MGGAKLGTLVQSSVGHLSDIAAASLFPSVCMEQIQSDICIETWNIK